MNYELAENEIKEALESNPDLVVLADIKLLPDSLPDYHTPTEKGLVTVAFIGEDYSRNQGVGDISQPTTVTFSISVQALKLRGSKGVYAISEIVKQTLVGLKISDADNLTLSEQTFNQYQNEIWEHTVTASCRSVRTQSNHNQLPDMDITDGEQVYYQKQSTDENIHV